MFVLSDFIYVRIVSSWVLRSNRERGREREREREREKKAFVSYGCKKYGSKEIRFKIFKMESVVVVNVVAVPVGVGVNSVVAELGVFNKKCAQNPGEEILCVTRFDEILPF